MSFLRKLAAVTASLSLAASAIGADETPAADKGKPVKAPTTTPERPTQPQPPQIVPVPGPGPVQPGKAGHTARPVAGRPVPMPRPDLPDDIKKLIDQFNQARETVLTSQKQMVIQLRDANSEQRDKLREQLRISREALAMQQSALREEIKGRIKELRHQLPSHREVLDEARQTTDGKKRGR